MSRPQAKSPLAVDELTIARARRGDSAAIATIYKTLSGPSFNLALRISGSRAMAEDVVHDAFIKAIDKLDSFRGESSLWTWVRRIVTNTTINAMSRQKWWRSLDELTDPNAPVMAEPSSNDESGAVETDLAAALARLKPQARTVLLLHDQEGMTHEEIAAMFSKTESYSKSVVSRARKEIRQWLNQ